MLQVTSFVTCQLRSPLEHLLRLSFNMIVPISPRDISLVSRWGCRRRRVFFSLGFIALHDEMFAVVLLRLSVKKSKGGFEHAWPVVVISPFVLHMMVV